MKGRLLPILLVLIAPEVLTFAQRTPEPPAADPLAAFTADTVKAQIVKTVQRGPLVYLPQAYAEDPTRRWPLVLFLHEAGERGSGLKARLRPGPTRMAADGQPLPFVLVAPQCAAREFWEPEALLALRRGTSLSEISTTPVVVSRWPTVSPTPRAGRRPRRGSAPRRRRRNRARDAARA